MQGTLLRKWYLEHVDPSQNKNKFFEISISQEDINSFVVYRRFGRIGTNTKAKPVGTPYSTYEAAEVAGQELVSKKRFNNKDVYDLKSDDVMARPLTAATRPKPAKAPEPEPFIIGQPEPVPEDFWGCINVA